MKMPRFHLGALAAGAFAAMSLGMLPPSAIGAPAEGPPAARAEPSAVVGSVAAIDPIRTRPKGTGVGAVAGGVVGGVLGHEVLGGPLGTLGGAAGGAVVGNNLERNHREGIAGYHVQVRLDNGHSRTITQAHIGDLRVGDRVRIEGGHVHRV
jgi:outer membrane lipoprotein SlyB